MISAFAYLLSRTMRNRLMAQAKRVRKPRYAFALLFGVAYLGFMIWGQLFARAHGASRAAMFGTSTEALAPAGIALMLGSLWLFGSDLAALAFTPAEVSILFTGPVSRRGLIVYKLIRMQFAILFSAFIWVVILRRGGGPIPLVATYLACWVLFATLGLHRLGAALMLAKSAKRQAEAGKGRSWLGRTVGLVVFVVLMTRMMPTVGSPGSSNPFGFVDSIAAMLSTPTMHAVLSPFRLLIAPLFAVTVSSWARALVPAVIILALHVVWVLRTDTAFEEAAIEATGRQAKRLAALRSRQRDVPVPLSQTNNSTLALSSTGRPALAIFWKNMLALKRQFSIGTLSRPIIIALVFSVAGLRTVHDPALIVAIACAYFAFMLMISGGQVMRNDLRSDMLHLPMLKTLPLKGADLVLAEIASSTFPLAAIQQVLVIIAAIALALTKSAAPIPAPIRLGVLVASPFALVAIDAAMLTVTNGMAVMFPGWTRLGPTGAAGFEVIGQVLLSMFAMLFGFLLLMIVPAAGAFATYWLLSASPGSAAAAAGLAASVVIALEVYAMVLYLGHAFERAEPQQVAQ